MQYSLKTIFLSVITVALFCITGCDENPTGNGLGPGNKLRATINGASYDFDFASSFATYDPASNRGDFGGTLTGSPSRTISLFFTYDIDSDTFPVTLTGSDVNITYIEDVGGSGQKSYNCLVASDDCTITLTGSDGDIVDGTFSALLSLTTDTNTKLNISGGTFSAELSR